MLNKRERIIQTARSLINVPFHHQGRTREGIDCGGFFVYIALEHGVPHIDDRRYKRRPEPKRMRRIIESGAKEIPIEEARPADFYWFWIKISTLPQHLGILIGDNKFIHAYLDRGKVVEEFLDEYWLKRIDSAWRFKGID